jgi:hypothetical protein
MLSAVIRERDSAGFLLFLISVKALHVDSNAYGGYSAQKERVRGKYGEQGLCFQAALYARPAAHR